MKMNYMLISLITRYVETIINLLIAVLTIYCTVEHTRQSTVMYLRSIEVHFNYTIEAGVRKCINILVVLLYMVKSYTQHNHKIKIP